MEFQLHSRETILLGIAFLFAGRWINQRIPFLNYYNIPEPVTGGLIASTLALMLHAWGGYTIHFDLTVRDALLLVFFTTIGLSARFTDLKRGGKPLLLLLMMASGYLFIQNLIGVGIAMAYSLPAEVGLLGGSVSMSGGHGTAIAWGEIFRQDYGLANAPEIGIACATFGLVSGGLIGGPLAAWLIRRHQLKSAEIRTAQNQQNDAEESPAAITTESFFGVALAVCVSVGIGIVLHNWLLKVGVRLPTFVTCLFTGIILNNSLPAFHKLNLRWPRENPTLNLISDISLGLFLSMSMMSLQLWTLASLALPLMLMMLAQIVGVGLYVVLMIFRGLGKNYDAAVIGAGIAGLTLGATPTAFVNMNAVTRSFGPSPMAFLVIPLIGAFFIDIANALCIQLFLDWLH